LDLVPGAPPERDGWLRPPAPSSECGVCGLLFENCIVDASILRTGAAAVAGVVFGRVRPVLWHFEFVIDRRLLPWGSPVVVGR
jgi:hypothetical protein